MNSITSSGGCIILLDVPPGSSITLDGITRVTPKSPLPSSSPAAVAGTPFDRGVWIINRIPTTTSAPSEYSPSIKNDDPNKNYLFHLIIVRCGIHDNSPKKSGEGRSSADGRTLPVGFVLSSSSSPPPSNSNDENHPGYDWIFARKYDPRTEEISNEPLDNLTLQNLMTAMKHGGELEKFVISYDQFMGRSDDSGNANGISNVGNGQSANQGRSFSNTTTTTTTNLPKWTLRTSLINSSYLQKRHGIHHGEKIVPCADSLSDIPIPNINNSEKMGSGTTNNGDNNDHKSSSFPQDGKSMKYPSIPCIDPTINARQIAQHAGTRTYLSGVSPETRTWLLFGGSSNAIAKTAADTGGKCNTIGEYVWEDIISRQYDNEEKDFLADIQLSFLMFLFLECHSSLEHWRDAVSMSSLALISNSKSSERDHFMLQHGTFFLELITIIEMQLSMIETEFFQEVEYSSGENNFLVGALQRICGAIDGIGRGGGVGIDDNSSNTREKLKSAALSLKHLVRERFQLDLSINAGQTLNNNNGDGCLEIEMLEVEKIEHEDGDSEDDDEDGPVIVPYEQVEASIARSSVETVQSQSFKYRNEYPLLYAAMAPQEDEVMACARILEEAKDVSLVREAAAYLEEVEVYREG